MSHKTAFGQNSFIIRFFKLAVLFLFSAYSFIVLGDNSPKEDHEPGQESSDIGISNTINLAEQGIPQAMGELAAHYQLGLGVSKSFEKAFNWHKKAAEQGVGESQYALGEMYAEGQYVNQDYTQAIYWLEESTKHEIVGPAAYMTLFILYSNGWGTSKNLEKAQFFSKKISQDYLNNYQGEFTKRIQPKKQEL